MPNHLDNQCVLCYIRNDCRRCVATHIVKFLPLYNIGWIYSLNSHYNLIWNVRSELNDSLATDKVVSRFATESNRLTALKTVSARIRGSKSDLESLGEDTADLADGFSKYATELKALTGFNIMQDGSTTEFKDLYDIMEGIAKVWDDLSDTSQARVAEILGGKYVCRVA